MPVHLQAYCVVIVGAAEIRGIDKIGALRIELRHEGVIVSSEVILNRILLGEIE